MPKCFICAGSGRISVKTADNLYCYGCVGTGIDISKLIEKQIKREKYNFLISS